ncbi:hypothetical protein ACFOLJ_13065 [Rugamonas sp. CCM 8940]|uniref:hypothetical protein n=1 Tax=Rugamonas sp. CCM 8940 TaxID=2765359 RepID=UPI0018F2F093|nr:hypothetical protein [Rugamonas sp. CCM 8940]MBJ7308924.1 hypothetical protein [Rugamonas sp. CCM 8940]
MPGTYDIIQSQLPLVGGLGGHNLIAIRDPGGNIIREYNGLATSSDGTIKAVGYLPSDMLKVYAFDSARYYSTDQHQQVLFSTNNYSEIVDRMGAMNQAAGAMNAANLSYPFLGFGKNSNSVDSTLISAMGLAERPIPNGAWIMPGVGDILLPDAAINAIKQNNNINSNYLNGANTGSQFDNSWPTPSYGDAFNNFVS